MPRRVRPLHDAKGQLSVALSAPSISSRTALVLMALGRIAEAELMRAADSAFASPGRMQRAAEDPAIAARLATFAKAILTDQTDLLQNLCDRLPQGQPPKLRIEPARYGFKI